MRGRQLTLAIIDEVWADYLANVAELRGGVIWTSWGSGDPLHKFLTTEREIYEDFLRGVEDGVVEAFEAATARDGAIEFQDPSGWSAGLRGLTSRPISLSGRLRNG